MPDRPKNLGYAGSEEFIRLQFEEYLLALLSAVKYHIFMESKRQELKDSMSEVGMLLGTFADHNADPKQTEILPTSLAQNGSRLGCRLKTFASSTSSLVSK